MSYSANRNTYCRSDVTHNAQQSQAYILPNPKRKKELSPFGARLKQAFGGATGREIGRQLGYSDTQISSIHAGQAEMLSYIPVSAIADTQGLNMTIMSYNGRCDFGLVADRDSVPDLWDLCHLLEEALEELKEIAGI